MSVLIYMGIFAFTIIEETLRTLRIIVVSNGKKVLGSILQFFIALIWIIVTGTVIKDIKNDPLKIIFYALGSLIGSFFGSTIEEKMALGYVEIIAEVNDDTAKKLMNEKYNIKKISGRDSAELLMITAKRKDSNDIIDLIKNLDNRAFIIMEKIKFISRH